MLPAQTRLGPYEVQTLVGQGGMGTVYRAIDTRLGREVAIKILSASSSSSDELRRRVLSEARLIARLSHPHICTLYDVGQEGTTDFLVMEFLKGETLASRIAEGPIGPAETTRLALQLADALNAAHSAGIVHRDLKPSNIMIVDSGAKLMDFGVAKAFPGQSDTTRTHSTTGFAGTLMYMAPEQIERGVADARSDIFSLGTVMFEMLSAAHPFCAGTDGGASYSRSTPAKLLDLVPGTPAQLAGIVEKCMRTSPIRRWQTAHDLAAALQSLSATAPRRRAKPRSGHKRLGLAVERLAILPFENLSTSADEFLSVALPELLRGAASRIGNLRVTALSSSSQYGSAPPDVAKACRELEVDALVSGAISRVGERLRVSVRLLGAVDGREVWSGAYERNFGDLGFVQRALAESIAGELGLRTSGSADHAVIRQTASPEAQELYLRGLYQLSFRTSSTLKEAGELLRRCLDLAPEYAVAHSALADWYIGMGTQRVLPFADALRGAQESANEALRLDPRIGRAHALLGFAALLEWDPRRAIHECRRAIELDPSVAQAYATWTRAAIALNRHDEAEAHGIIARQLDPLSIRGHLPSIQAAIARGDSQRALDLCGAAELVAPPNDVRVVQLRGMANFFLGRYSAAVDDLKRAAAGTSHPSSRVALAYVLGQLGRDPAVLTHVLSELSESATMAEATPYDFAEVYAGLGMPDKAMRYLQRALELRQPEMVELLSDPLLTPLRDRPDFAELVRAVGLVSG